ncbi:HutD/Ves family protein [Collimonas antrihumi]|uniref:HutD/Ves family protein n=1 Tax=Collimonas antrihumi TaxID=1940615 RepID=UPI001B8B6D6A|nr:HutD family protein [Collimonas antrihumi]
MPWKNGGGITREIMRCPANSSLDDFEWRISVATVSTAGQFSIFPGIDRSLALTEGGKLLISQGARRVTLTPATPVFEFAGEEQIGSSLLAGPVTDFNVMTRRQLHTHKLNRFAFTGTLCTPRLGHTSLVYIVKGSPHILLPTSRVVQLAPGDAVLLTASDQQLTLHAMEAEIMVTNIFGVSA